MGLGPVPAVRTLERRTGIVTADIDLTESNEAFAAQACAVSRQLDLDPARVNPNGGAVALGHPVGATGAILTVKLVYELARRDRELGLVTMCIGGGQGIAHRQRWRASGRRADHRTADSPEDVCRSAGTPRSGSSRETRWSSMTCPISRTPGTR